MTENEKYNEIIRKNNQVELNGQVIAALVIIIGTIFFLSMTVGWVSIFY